jgi:hypothetical protein
MHPTSLHFQPPGISGARQGDSRLRSVWHFAGYELWATDGEIGRLERFIVDDASLAGDWLYRRSVLVPTRAVESISWAGHRLNLHRSRAQI